MLKLYELQNNESAIIEELTVNEHAETRLSEMGVMPGTIIRMIRKNPFGGPIQLKVNNYYLAIRKEDALKINVKIDDNV